MIHEMLHTRWLLKSMMKAMNDIPYEQRDDDIKEIRKLVQNKMDSLGRETVERLRKKSN